MATDREKLETEARYQQMKINTRLTALQSAHTLMGLYDYAGSKDSDALLKIAAQIEEYILKDIAPPPETPQRPTIVKATEMPRRPGLPV